MSEPATTKQTERMLAEVETLLHAREYRKNPLAFIEGLLDAIPNLIEPGRDLTHEPEKFKEWMHVKANADHLRHVVRQYYRNTQI